MFVFVRSVVCSHKDVEDDNGSLGRVLGISEMLHNNQDFLDIHDFLGKRQRVRCSTHEAAAPHAINTEVGIEINKHRPIRNS